MSCYWEQGVENEEMWMHFKNNGGIFTPLPGESMYFYSVNLI